MFWLSISGSKIIGPFKVKDNLKINADNCKLLDKTVLNGTSHKQIQDYINTMQ